LGENSRGGEGPSVILTFLRLEVLGEVLECFLQGFEGLEEGWRRGRRANLASTASPPLNYLQPTSLNSRNISLKKCYQAV